MTQSEWVSQQITSWQNIFSVLSILCLMLYLIIHDYNTTTIIVFFVLFFLATAWQMLATMIFFSLIVGGIVTVLPFLAPVAFVIMLLLFFARIGFVIKNWRAVIAGFAVYGLAYTLYSDTCFEFINPIFNAGGYILNIIPDSVIAHLQVNLFYDCYSCVFTACFIACAFQLLLYWLYRNGYSASGALNIMGSIPLVIIALLLPFLKAAAVDGAFDAGHTGDFAHEGSFAHDSTVSHDPYVKAPGGYHHVNSYDRVGTDGQLEHVRGYIRSNPDGILENNLSYNGYHMTDQNSVGHDYAQLAHTNGTIDVPYAIVGNTYSKSFSQIIDIKHHIFTSIILGFFGTSFALSMLLYFYFTHIKI